MRPNVSLHQAAALEVLSHARFAKSLHNHNDSNSFNKCSLSSPCTLDLVLTAAQLCAEAKGRDMQSWGWPCTGWRPGSVALLPTESSFRGCSCHLRMWALPPWNHGWFSFPAFSFYPTQPGKFTFSESVSTLQGCWSLALVGNCFIYNL